MNYIEIPNYNTTLTNIVWTKDTGLITTVDGIQVPVLEMMIISKYTAPSKQDTIKLIQKIAREHNQNSIHTNGEEKGEIVIARYAQMFQKEFLEQIAKGENNAITELTKRYPEDGHEPGKNYIQIGVGIITKKMIDIVKDLAKEYGARTYDGL